jgi:hypothetical protein
MKFRDLATKNTSCDFYTGSFLGKIRQIRHISREKKLESPFKIPTTAEAMTVCVSGG